MTRVHIIRANGDEDTVVLDKGRSAGSLIGADALDGFRMRDGRYVHVDDNGAQKNLPVNRKATAMYRLGCKPGTTWQIRGDVAITEDE